MAVATNRVIGPIIGVTHLVLLATVDTGTQYPQHVKLRSLAAWSEVTDVAQFDVRARPASDCWPVS